MTWREVRSLASETIDCWSERNAPRLGAALAYYSLLSIAPLMILVVAICGLVFRQSAEQQVLEQTRQYIGSGGAATLKMLLDNAHHPRAGIFASFLALVTLLFGASGVFTELRGSLNAIWEVTAAKGGGVKGMVAQRVGAFLMVLGLGALLLFSLLVSAALAVMEQFATSYVPVPAAILGEVLNVVSSLCLLTLLFALIYKFVPDTPLQWRDVTVGAAVTSALFMVGKTLLAIYFSTAAVGSTYGAAGSVVAFVVWVYYSAQIFFLGAVFTRTFARRVGSQKRVIAPPFVKAQNA